MKAVLKLSTIPLNQKKVYLYESKSIVITKEAMIKNSSKSKMIMELMGDQPNGDGAIFRINTIHDEFGGGSFLKPLSEKLNPLIYDIRVLMDAQGHLEKILNMDEVLGKWELLKDEWKGEMNKDNRSGILKAIRNVDSNLNSNSFEPFISEQGALYFLFNGLQGEIDSENKRRVKKQLDNVLITQPLPLNIDYTLSDFNKVTRKLVLEGKGSVDEEKFNEGELTRHVRKLTDTLNLEVKLKVEYVEKFEFDEQHWLQEANQELKITIPGFFRIESKQSIIQEI